MSAADELALLARELARLAARGSSRALDPAGVRTALAARTQMLDLLRQLLHDAVDGRLDRARSGGASLSVGAVDANPVAALYAALHRSRRDTAEVAAAWAQAVTVADAAVRSPVAPEAAEAARESWDRVGQHTEVAEQLWSAQRPLLTLDERWSVIADVAALAQALTVVDQDLLVAAREHQLTATAAVVERIAGSGMRAAAAETAALAASGTLPPWEEADPAPGLVLLVRSPEDLAAAQERLVGLLQLAPELSPQAVVLVATGQARLLAAAAAGLGRVGGREDEVSRAGALARHLTAAARYGHQVAGRYRGDQRPVMQTREIVQALGAGRVEHPPEHLAAAAARSPAVIRTLARRADQLTREGRWLVVNPSAQRPTDSLWIPTGVARDEPALTAALAAAAVHATAAPSPPLRTVPGRADRSPPPRQALQEVLGLYRRQRPAHPATRPRADPER